MATQLSSPNFPDESNHTPIIQIVTWVLLACAVICTVFRAFTKWGIIRNIGIDDYFVPISLFFLAGQSAAITVATANGLGKPERVRSEAQTERILQSFYASLLLYCASLFFSKLPTLVLLRLITPKKSFRLLFFLCALGMFAWVLTSEFIIAFQCVPPTNWDFVNGRCMNRKAFLIYFESMNVFTDLLLVILPVIVVWRVRTSVQRKTSIIAVFACRLLPMGAAICKLVFQNPDFTSPDPLFTAWPSTICTQIIQFMSLVAACMLYLRPFLEALTSGFINGDDLRRRGQIRPYVTVAAGTMPVNLAAKELSERASKQSLTNQTKRQEIESRCPFARAEAGGGPGGAAAVGGGVGMREMQQEDDYALPPSVFVLDGRHLPRVSRIYTPLEAEADLQTYVHRSNNTSRHRLPDTAE